MQARAVLAVFEDLVGQLGFVFNGTEAVLEEEVGNAREKADGLDAVHLGFFNERAENAAPGTLIFCLGLDDDGAHLREMRAVEMERAAAKEDAAIGLSYCEIADVFADLREGALKQRAVG